MHRPSLLAGWLALVLACAAPFAAPYAQSAPQETSLNEVKKAVLDATGYDGGSVELVSTKIQLVVTIVNSKLIDRPSNEREREAERIASTIAHTVAGKPEFESIQAIHVDYVRRQADGHTDRIDGIDFRKDPQGNFQHHIT
jgi:hypothetical protein